MTEATWTAVKPHLLQAWQESPGERADQLIHAVDPGSDRAACGVVVAVTGEAWPDPVISTPSPRCSICTAAAEAAWKDASQHP